MRKISLLSVILLITLFTSSFAQDTAFLHQYNFSRIKTTKTAMVVLGGWGVANIAAGLIGRSQTDGQTKYFHEMNAIWGAVNLGIATASYLGNRKLNPEKYNWQGSVQEQHKIEKIYLINGALDLTYIAGGLFLREYGKNKLPGKDQDRLKGYGVSIVAQGVFLLLYDGINFTIHHQHGKQLFSKFNELQFSVAPGGVTMRYNL